MRHTLVFLSLAAVLPGLSQAQEQGQAQQDPAQAFIQRFDQDKDGKVSRDEFLKPAAEQFKYMDRNGDGAISMEESQTMAEELKKRMEQMHQQQGGSQ